MITIRPEIPDDIAAIDRINRDAFEGQDEAALVERLRSGVDDTISLVAVDDETGVVVGHLLVSPMTLDPAEGSRAAEDLDLRAIGPMSVAPDRQRQGIGSQLVDEAIVRCRDAGVAILFVLGDPAFYARFGFDSTAPCDIASTYEVAPQYFMLNALRDGAEQGVAGIVRYHPHFQGI